MSTHTDEAAQVLEKIRSLDAQEWGLPSNSRAAEIHRLEARYEDMTGQPCPAWPARGRPRTPDGEAHD